MMRQHLLTRGFALFRRIVQKEVYQNSIDFRLWVLTQDLSFDEFYAPDTAACIVLVCFSTDSGVTLN